MQYTDVATITPSNYLHQCPLVEPGHLSDQFSFTYSVGTLIKFTINILGNVAVKSPQAEFFICENTLIIIL